jgi:hypothetical protein
MPRVNLTYVSRGLRCADEIGKTSEAKGDMARLQEVRRRREAAAKQREAEAAGTSPFNPLRNHTDRYRSRTRSSREEGEGKR